MTKNTSGLNRTLKALRSRLGPEHAALVALAKGLAAAIDAEPNNAALWREYRAVVTTLAEVSGEDSDDDSAEFLSIVRTPGRAAVGDSS